VRGVDVVRGGREDVEDEPSAWDEQGARRSERAPSFLVGVQMQVRAKRADHERHALVDGRIEQVAHPQVELHTRECGAPRTDVEHPARRIDADHADPVGGDRNGDAAGADAELDNGPTEPARLVEIEADVLGDGHAPRVVQLRDPVVRTRHVYMVTPWLSCRASSCLPGPGSPGTGADAARHADLRSRAGADQPDFDLRPRNT
jgi:hypothetical protein